MHQIKTGIMPICFVTLLFTLFFTACKEKQIYQCNHIEKIEIDGYIDTVWSKVEWQQIRKRKTYTNYADSSDLYVKFKSCWDNEGINLLFYIHDDTLFDVSKFRYQFDIPPFDETDCISIIFATNEIKRYNIIRSSNDTVMLINLKEGEYKIRTNNYACIVEIRIPWKNISDRNYMNIKMLPFEVYVYDNDNDPTKGFFPVKEFKLGNFKMKRTILSWSENENVMEAENKSNNGYLNLSH